MQYPQNFTGEQRLAYKRAVSQPDRTWAVEITIDTDNGEHLILTDGDIVADSLIMKEQSTCSDGITVGSTYANSLEFSLINGNGQFREFNFMKAKVTATSKLYIPETEEWAEIKLGTFTVLEAGKKYSTIPIKCIDRMCLFNRPLSDAKPTFPVQLKNLFMSICLMTGVTYTTELYEQIPELTLGAFEADKLTCRDFLSYLGCLIGKNLRMSRNDQLESFWYEETDYTTTPDTRVNITLNDLSVHPTSVVIKDWNGTEYTPDNADSSYSLILDTNPLIQNEETAASVLRNLNDLLTSVNYRTYDCQFIGDPAVQAGDIITHLSVKREQMQEPSAEGYVMSHEYRFRGSGKLAAMGKTPEQDRQLTANAKKIIEVKTQAAKDLNEGLTSAQQALLNQTNLLTESLALYAGTKYDDKGRLIGYYMASEPIFAKDGVIAPDDSNVDPRKDCYVWTYSGGGIGVSDSGYFGTYSGITKDKSIVARTITAEWIRTGVLSALDNSLQIDLESGEQTIKALDGWGKTVLDGIGEIFKYWNKNVTVPGDDGHPPIAYLRITADADENPSTKDNVTADLKLVWASYDGSMYTSAGHTVIHAKNGTETESHLPFEIKSSKPIHVSPGLFFDDSLLFDNIIMRRTNTVAGNTGVDFLVVPKAAPLIPILEEQVNLISNPGFETNSLSPWNLSRGSWPVISDSDYVHAGKYAAKCPDDSENRIYLTSSVLSKMGFYDHPTYIGFWMKASGDNVKDEYPLCLRSGPSASGRTNTYIEVASDGKEWTYVSAIIPKLTANHVINLYSDSDYGYAVDDFHVYDAKNYSKEQWDEYVKREVK